MFRYSVLVVAGVFACSGAQLLHAQELVPENVEIVRARVVYAGTPSTTLIPGTRTEALTQHLEVLVLEGTQKGQTIAVENDYIELKEGEVFYLRHSFGGADTVHRYTVLAPNRIPALAGLVALFLATLVVFGGKQGLRGLLALVASLFFIGYLLFPGILSGYPPVLVAMGVSSLIVIIGSYVTHGVNRTTSAAVVGMLATITLTGALAYFAIDAGRLSGFSGDEVTYLNFDTGGAIDVVGLLLGSIMIGLLGVLYDAAIGQAVSVEELARAGKHLSAREVYQRGIRIGREHIGALVNTLAIAYVGAALPLLLLFRVSFDEGPLYLLNQEVVATEIVRMLVGSIGLVLAVPITTAIAVWMLMPRHA